MPNERNYVPGAKIIGYNVSPAPDGGFYETPIYAESVSSIQVAMPQDFEDESYGTAAFYDDTEETPVEDNQPAKLNQERKSNRRSSLRGNPLAKAAFYLAGVTTVIYGTDVGVTYLKESRVVSPVDAYKDFTELPTLVKPVIDGAQTLIRFASGK